MWPFSRTTAAVRPPVFRQCAGCEFDFVTGEGERSCNWGACPYLPAALDPTCPVCNYNFATDEGRPHCGNLATCEEAAAGYERAAAALAHFGG